MCVYRFVAAERLFAPVHRDRGEQVAERDGKRLGLGHQVFDRLRAQLNQLHVHMNKAG